MAQTPNAEAQRLAARRKLIDKLANQLEHPEGASLEDTKQEPPGLRMKPASELRSQFDDSGDGDSNSPETETPTVTTNAHMEWQPFPIETLSGRFRAMADAVSECVGTDPSMVILPMLAAASTAIGNSRYLATKKNTEQPLMLWPVVIAPSGAQKSAPFEYAEQPLNLRNERLADDHKQADVEHDQALEIYRAELTDWKSSNREGSPPVKPISPPRGRLTIVDFSWEALVECHAGHPRCIHVSGEEFGAIFGMLDRYGDGKAAKDVFQLLRAYDGRSLTNERAKSTRICPGAFLQLNGATQPKTFKRCLSETARATGFAARLWPVMPPVNAIRWSDNIVSDDVIAGWDSLIGGLFELPPADESGGVAQAASDRAIIRSTPSI